MPARTTTGQLRNFMVFSDLERCISLTYILPQILCHEYRWHAYFQPKSVFLEPENWWLTDTVRSTTTVAIGKSSKGEQDKSCLQNTQKGLAMRSTLTRARKSQQVLPPTSNYNFKNSSPQIHNHSTRQVNKVLEFLLPTRFPFSYLHSRAGFGTS